MNPESEPPVIPLVHCAACGALCQVGQTRCWLCHGDPLADNAQTTNRSDARTPASALDAVFWVLLVICFGLAVLVALGLATDEPGLLIPYAIVVGPAFLIPGVRAMWQIGRGERPRPSKFLLNAVMTLAVTIAVIVLLVMAAVALLFLMCLSSASGL